MIYEIKKWTDGSVIYKGDAESLEVLVHKAINEGVSLSYANLQNLHFVGTTFDGTRFVGTTFDGTTFVDTRFDGTTFVDTRFDGTTFVGTTFDGTRFVGTTFVDTRFDGTTFDGTTFVGTTFDGTRFVGTTFDGTTFVGTTFDGTTFDETSLREVQKALNPIKADFFLILLKAIPEIPFLRQTLIDGKIDGSTYEGSCACLCGTIAKARHCSYESLEGIKPDSQRPAEEWFKAIRPDLTPENNQIAKITLDWIDEFISCLKNIPTENFA